MYGISIVGHRMDLIVKPFAYSSVTKIGKIMLVVDGDSKANETAQLASRELSLYGVAPVVIPVKNIFDFKEVLLLSKRLKSEMRRPPEWVNVTAGPGIAVAALVLAFPESDLIHYQEGPPARVSVVNTLRTMDAFKGLDRTIPVFDYVKRKEETDFEEMSAFFNNESKATLSRRLSQLIEVGLLESKGAGRGRQRKKYYLKGTR